MADLTPVKFGNALRANTFLTGGQYESAITQLADGGYIVTWTSSVQDGNLYGVYAQRFSADGNPAGSEFRVNTYTIGFQEFSDIRLLSDGKFIAVWNSNGQDGSSYGVYAKIYNADGSNFGGEFRVNTTTSGAQLWPTIASLSDGGFVVAWSGSAATAADNGIFIQRYDANGGPVGSQLRIDQSTGVVPYQPQITELKNGGFAVAWNSSSDNGVTFDVNTQTFDAIGASGVQKLVNSYTAGNQSASTVASLNNGNYVVAWQSDGQDGSGYGVYAQIFSQAGNKVGSEFRLNQNAPGDQSDAQIAALPDGGFLVVWTTNSSGIYAQRFDQGGLAVGNEVSVDGNSGGLQYQPAVTALENGDVTVSWTSQTDVFTQKLSIEYAPTGSVTIEGALVIGSTLTAINNIADLDGLGTLHYQWQRNGLDLPLNQDPIFVLGPDDIETRISVKVTYVDGGGRTETVTSAFTPLIGHVNVAPSSTPVTLTPIAEDSVTRLITQSELLSNATDVDSTSLTASGLQISSGRGTLVSNGNGTWSYTPAPNDETSVSFTYLVSDGQASVSGTATLDILPADEFASALVSQWPEVAALSGGGHVVVTTSLSNAIAANIFNAAGDLVSIAFVNTSAASGMPAPSVAGTGDGGFVTVWGSAAGFIVGQRVSALGVKLGSEFAVNTGLSGEATVTELASGGFVVTWQQQVGPANGDYIDVFARVYDPLGASISGPFIVNDAARAGFQGTNAGIAENITGLSSGGFAVCWLDTQSGSNIKIRVYDQVGNALSAEVGANTGEGAEIASIAGLKDGGFIVTWQNPTGFDGSAAGVFCQRFSGQGQKLGGEFQANSYFLNNQTSSKAVALDDGGFVIVWESNGADGANYGISGQRFSSSGNRVGGEFIVNSVASTSDYAPSIALRTDGSLVVTWINGGALVEQKIIYDLATDVRYDAVLSGVPVNLGSVAEEGSVTITQSQLLAGVTEAIGPATIASLALTSGAGQLVNNGNGTWTYTGALDDTSAATFSYKATDGAAAISSSATLDLTPVNDAPTGAVAISGNLVQGATLTTTDTLADADGLGTVVYQWQRNGLDLPLNTGKFFVLGQDDVGKQISVKATYIDGGGTVESVTSAPTALIADVNDAPTSANASIDLKGNPASYTFKLSDFPFHDVDPADTLRSIKITSVPPASAGELRLNGIALTAANLASLGTIGADDIANGHFSFVRAPGGFGNQAFSFAVEDRFGVDDNGLATGITGAWAFNGNTGDLSGNLHTLALAGGASFGSGQSGQGLHLDGAAGSFARETTNNPAFDLGNRDFTIQTWVKFDSTFGEQTLVEKLTGAGNAGWTLTKLSNNVLQFYSAEFQLNSAPLSISSNTWHQFTATRIGDLVYLFMDGAEVAGQDFIFASISASASPLLIGARNAEDGRNFTVKGDIDNVFISDHGVSHADVATGWNGGAGHPLQVPGISPTQVMTLELPDVPVAIADVYTGALDGLSSRYGFESQILLNDGQAHFVGSNIPGSSALGTSVAIGDLNGDGIADAFVSAATNSKILLNDGHGQFTLQSTAGDARVDSQAAVIGDFNGDGSNDVFVTGYSYDSAFGPFAPNQLLLNDGHGNFSSDTVSGSGQGAFDAEIADINGDGKNDVVVANAYSQSQVYYGDGAGHFTIASLGPSGVLDNGIAVGDIDGNGTADIFIADRFGPNRLLLNEGNGTFSTVAAPGGSSGGNDAVIGDFNDDGRKDIFVTTSGSSQLLINNGNGTFTTHVVAVNGVHPWAADLDGNGTLDILVSAGQSGNVALLNDGTGNFVAQLSLPQDLSSNIALADFNHDGYGEDTSATLRVLDNDKSTNAGAHLSIASVMSASSLGAALSISPDGQKLIYDPTHDPALQSLAQGQQVTDTFTYVVSDESGGTSAATVSILVTGRNDDATITASANEDTTVVEAGGTANLSPGDPVASGQLTVHDIDSGENRFQAPASLAGQYGTFGFVPSTGAWTYALDQGKADALVAGQQVTDTLTVKSFDGTASKDIVLTITGSNDAPMVVADVAHATEAGGAFNGTAGVNPTGNVLGNDTDVDTGGTAGLSVTSITAPPGAHGTLTFNADGSYSYAVNQADAAVQALRTAGNTLTDVYTYTVRDQGGLTSQATLSVVVHGANDAPVAVADTGSLTENQTLAFSVLANDTDVDAGDSKTLSSLGQVQVTSPNGVVNGIDASAAVSIVNGQIRFVAGNLFDKLTGSQTATVVIPYTVSDLAGATATEALTLTVNGAYDRPVVTGITPDTGTSATDRITSATAFSVRGTADSGVTVNVYDGATLLGTAVADVSGAWSLPVTVAAGVHPLTAKLVVGGAETLASTAVSVTVDTAGPVTTFTGFTLNDTGKSASDAVTTDGQVALAGAVTDPLTTTVAVWNGATKLGNATVSAGTWTYAANLAAGTYQLKAIGTDAAGNTTEAVAPIPTLVVDKTAPTLTIAQVLAQDTGTSNTDRVTSNGTVTVSGVLSDANGVATTVAIYDTAAPATPIGAALVDAAGAWTFTTVLGTGVHGLYAVGLDAAGNSRTTAVLPTITVDLAGPAITFDSQSLTADTGMAGDLKTSNGAIVLMGTVDTTGPGTETVEIFNGATKLGNATVNAAAGTWTLATTLLAGTYALSATATDQSGRTTISATQAQIVVDSTAPTLTIAQAIAADTGRVTNDRVTANGAYTLSGSVADPGTGVSSVAVWDAATNTKLGDAAMVAGTWSFGGVLTDGPHQLYAIATDVAGNTRTSATQAAITVDTVGPAVAFTSQILTQDTGMSANDRVTSNGAVTLTGTGADNRAGLIVEVWDAATVSKLGNAVLDTNAGTWTYSTTLAAGPHSLYAKAVDLAGNALDSAPQSSILIDKTAPLPKFTDLTTGAGNSFAFAGITEAASAGTGATVSLYDNGSATAFATVTGAGNGGWSVASTAFTDVVHTITVKSTDAAGNIGTGTSRILIGSSGANTLTGTAGDEFLFGSGGNDKLTGSGGSDQLTGGGGADTFIFAAGFGKDIVTDFASGADKLQFAAAVFATTADVLSHAGLAPNGLDTVITFDANHTVTLKNVGLLTAADVLIA